MKWWVSFNTSKVLYAVSRFLRRKPSRWCGLGWKLHDIAYDLTIRRIKKLGVKLDK